MSKIRWRVGEEVNNCVTTNINHKGLQRTANEYAEERSIYKDLISKNEKWTYKILQAEYCNADSKLIVIHFLVVCNSHELKRSR